MFDHTIKRSFNSVWVRPFCNFSVDLDKHVEEESYFHTQVFAHAKKYCV